MKIIDVRILPPIAIGRLGSSPDPLDAYDLEPASSDNSAADYRRIVPKMSFKVNDAGQVANAETPLEIQFKDMDGNVRPVAPFLEVFAITDTGKLLPLTLDLLMKANLTVKNCSWSVKVGNHKVFRRTRNEKDQIGAVAPDNKGDGAMAPQFFSDHKRHELNGRCENFLGGKTGKTLPLGSVRFIEPTDEFQQIRLRFTPAAGKVYGSSTKRIPAEGQSEVDDPVITTEDLVRYDATKGWRGFIELSSGAAQTKQEKFFAATRTSPEAIFAGIDVANGRQSWGYLDDECDGIVTFCLKVGENELKTRAVIVAGPPAYAPDSTPVRVVSDELEQLLMGPDVIGLDVAEALEQTRQIIRRSLDTVRLMNTTIANAGRNSMASRDQLPTATPIMAPSLVDNPVVVGLHEQILAALASGTPPWFSEALRLPEEVGDLTDPGRRKMPALMRNADGNYLALTRRMINTVVLAETQGAFQRIAPQPATAPKLTPENLTAQLHHRGEGNPYSVLAKTAISNCFPGLEFDFRNFWRRAFEEIVLLENSNIVFETKVGSLKSLVGCRLLRVGNQNISTPVIGPGITPGRSTFMEWSNSLAGVLQKQGEQVLCVFTAKPTDNQVLFGDPNVPTVAEHLTVRKLFDENSGAVAEGAVEPGDLTQGLCAPWQNDYRECACFYWAASRPDYVNIDVSTDGLSRGDNWLAKERTGSYVPDDRRDLRLVTYDDLFLDWEKSLRFIIGGRDAEAQP